MQRYVVMILLLLLLVVSCNRQGYRDNTDPYAKLKPDSITRIIKDHILKIDKLRYSNPDSALKLIGEAEKLSKTLIASNKEDLTNKGYRYLGESLNFKGVTNTGLGNYEEALLLHREALKIYKKIGYERGIGNSYNDIGLAYMQMGQYTNAIENFYKFLEISKKIGFLHGEGQAYNNIGIIYFYREEYEDALGFYQKHYQTANELDNIAEKTYALNNIGEVYDILGDFDKAVDCFTKGIALSDSANNSYMKAYLLGNLGQVEQKQNNFETAKAHYEQSLELREQVNDKEGISLILNKISALHLQTNNEKKAVDYAKQALTVAKEHNVLQEIKNAYHNLYNALEKQHKYKEALHYHTLFKTFSDSLFDNARNKEIAEIEVQYQTREKENQIALQKELIIRGNILRNSLIAGVLLLLITSFLIYRSYRKKKETNLIISEKNHKLTRANEKISTQNEYINQQKEMLEQQNVKLQMSEASLQKLNQTKDRFFSILAHDMKTPLISFKKISGSLEKNIETIPKDQLQYYISQLNQSASNVVNLFNNLLQWSVTQTKKDIYNPVKINASETVNHCTSLLGSALNEKKITVKNTLDEEEWVYADKNMIATVFRNLLSNAIKFTPEEGTITIASEEKEGIFQYSVSDSGPGLSEEDQKKLFRIDVKNKDIGNDPDKKGTGLGLILCQEFIKQHGQKIWVSGKPDKGCTFSFTLEKFS
ncbi:MAG: tetratricopeptide repeat-containing sensor histidine kinase [Prolixibacteraceae bacterium]|nr:tetratricopeptide repeat-containing sensor histidine kinase [Prolixibacteraceae bacterium]